MLDDKTSNAEYQDSNDRMPEFAADPYLKTSKKGENSEE
jgi:hypothetical protein